MTHRILVPVAAVLAAGVFAVPAAADPGSADHLHDGGSGQCATLGSTTDPLAGIPVVAADCGAHESTGQSWYRDGAESIVAAGTGRYLAAPDSRPVAGDPVTADIFDDTVRQQWTVDVASGRISPVAAPELAVTAGPQLTLQPWVEAAEQRWTFGAATVPSTPVVPAAAAAPTVDTGESLPTTGTSASWLLAGGASTVLLAAMALLVLRGRRRLLRGGAHW